MNPNDKNKQIIFILTKEAEGNMEKYEGKFSIDFFSTNCVHDFSYMHI